MESARGAIAAIVLVMKVHVYRSTIKVGSQYRS